MIDERAEQDQRTEKPSQVVYTMLMNVDRKSLMQDGQDFARETPLFQDVPGCLLTVDPMQVLKRRPGKGLSRTI